MHVCKQCTIALSHGQGYENLRREKQTPPGHALLKGNSSEHIKHSKGKREPSGASSEGIKYSKVKKGAGWRLQ